MLPRTWFLEPPNARLTLERLSATIDLHRPDLGLSRLNADQNPFAGASLLGLACRANGAPLGELAESYQRGHDLIAVFRQPPNQAVRVDAVWRAAMESRVAVVRGLVDLIVSVQTDLLDSCPEVVVCSAIPSAEVLRPTDAGWLKIELDSEVNTTPLRITRDEGPGCLVFRVPDADFTYAEMVHPADFQESQLSGSGNVSTRHVSHRLFVERLEKGVILRGRVRGILVDRRDDLRLAAECYAAFAEAEPPLGT